MSKITSRTSLPAVRIDGSSVVVPLYFERPVEFRTKAPWMKSFAAMHVDLTEPNETVRFQIRIEAWKHSGTVRINLYTRLYRELVEKFFTSGPTLESVFHDALRVSAKNLDFMAAVEYEMWRRIQTSLKLVCEDQSDCFRFTLASADHSIVFFSAKLSVEKLLESIRE